MPVLIKVVHTIRRDGVLPLHEQRARRDVLTHKVGAEDLGSEEDQGAEDQGAEDQDAEDQEEDDIKSKYNIYEKNSQKESHKKAQKKSQKIKKKTAKKATEKKKPSPSWRTTRRCNFNRQRHGSSQTNEGTKCNTLPSLFY